MEGSSILLGMAIGLGALALILALSSHRRISSTVRALAQLGRLEGKTILEAVATYVSHVKALQSALDSLGGRHESLAAMVAESARNLGVVRYDAFEEMGGQMSFSAALLDDDGYGVVMTSINGRSEARTYAKLIEGGRSEHNLSPEEQKAIAEAMSRHTKVRRWR